jgi:hypothetical protein
MRINCHPFKPATPKFGKISYRVCKKEVRMKKIVLFTLLLLFSVASYGDHGMNQGTLEKIVKSMAVESSGENGFVEFSFNNVKMYLISDIKHDRMRIVAPIAEYRKLTQQHLNAVLEANYNTSLDARYAVNKDVLYAAFLHPLSELSRLQLKSSVKQVANLALSFGREYSSGVLTYGGEHKNSE